MTKEKDKASLSTSIGDLLRAYKKGGNKLKGKRSKKMHKKAVSAAFDMMNKSRSGK